MGPSKAVFLAPEIFGPDRTPPSTPYEALQRSGPFEPEESTMERGHPLEDVIAAVLSDFDDLDRDMIVMHLIGGLSTRQIAEVTGVSKSVVHRRLPILRERLTEAMKNNPEVLEYMEGM